MVSALVSGSNGPGLSPGRGHCVGVVFLRKTFNFHSASPLSTQEYKRVPANCWAGNLANCGGMTPVQGE